MEWNRTATPWVASLCPVGMEVARLARGEAADCVAVVDDEQAVTYGCLMEWAEALTAHLSEGWIGVRGAEEKRPGWFGGCPPVAEVGNGGCDLSPPPLFMSFKIPPNNNA